MAVRILRPLLWLVPSLFLALGVAFIWWDQGIAPVFHYGLGLAVLGGSVLLAALLDRKCSAYRTSTTWAVLALVLLLGGFGAIVFLTLTNDLGGEIDISNPERLLHTLAALVSAIGVAMTSEALK